MRIPVPSARVWPLPLIALLLVLGVGGVMAMLVPQEDDDLSDSPYLRIDPEKMVISEEDPRVPCGECHALEYETWTETEHATGFEEMHRSEQAQDILDRMDFHLAKRQSLCLRCHYTAKIVENEPRAVAGVSCESCHGAARDWLDVHNDYGSYDHDTEPEEHRKQRVKQSVANGMLRPSGDLYAVAANCYECHTVPQEKLINTGGHPSGSDFELVAWTDSIRHNFLEAQWSDDRTNDPPSPARKRLMYVLGRSLDYEYSIRGLAKADGQGIYAKAMESRVKSAHKELRKILQLVTIPEIKKILSLGGETTLAPSNSEGLVAAADSMRGWAKQFEDAYDGDQLAEVDRLIAGENVELASRDPFGETAEGSGGDEGDEAPEPSSAPDVATSEASLPELPGDVRSRPAWVPEHEYDVVGPEGCNCHVDQQRWWYDDAHNASASALLDNSQKAVQIATLYGLDPAEMKRGDAMCMNCHGTTLSGEENERVYNGVSCESCHGPGGEYAGTDQHEKYADGASQGMRQLEAADLRAQTCSRCHHITDERLLTAGHPTGEGFTLSERNEQVEHWESPMLSADELDEAYAEVTQSRPVPTVDVAEAPEIQTTGQRGAESDTASGQATSDQRQPVPPPPARTRPATRSGVPPPRTVPSVTLPPFPEVGDSTSVERLMLLLKQRLELVHQKVGGN